MKLDGLGQTLQNICSPLSLMSASVFEPMVGFQQAELAAKGRHVQGPHTHCEKTWRRGAHAMIQGSFHRSENSWRQP